MHSKPIRHASRNSKRWVGAQVFTAFSLKGFLTLSCFACLRKKCSSTPLRTPVVGRIIGGAGNATDNRSGDVKLTWLHEFTRFENCQHQPYDEFQGLGPAEF